MKCPSCSKVQPMSSQCRFCGAPLVRRTSAASPAAVGRRAPRAAAAAVALDNPYEAPQAISRAPVRVSYGERALAGRGSRLSAHLVDALIAVGIFLPILLGGVVGSEGESSFMGTAVMISGVGVLGLAVYQILLLSRDGQTLGKKAMKIRIVRYDDGSNPGFGRAVGLRVIVNGLIGIVPFYALVDLLFIFGAERRCLHDYIAGTKVVEA